MGEEINKEAKALLEFIDDFGRMSTGQLIQKYPDVGGHEGFHAITRRANALRRALDGNPTPQTRFEGADNPVDKSNSGEK